MDDGSVCDAGDASQSSPARWVNTRDRDLYWAGILNADTAAIKNNCAWPKNHSIQTQTCAAASLFATLQLQSASPGRVRQALRCLLHRKYTLSLVYWEGAISRKKKKKFFYMLRPVNKTDHMGVGVGGRPGERRDASRVSVTTGRVECHLRFPPPTGNTNTNASLPCTCPALYHTHALMPRRPTARNGCKLERVHSQNSQSVYGQTTECRSLVKPYRLAAKNAMLE